jgi:hypothetical protein
LGSKTSKGENSMNNEDITQDPEYIRGYEDGMERYRYDNSLRMKGWHAGYHALETPKTVESKATPSQPEQYVTRAEFEQFKREISERIKKLEDYYGRNK